MLPSWHDELRIALSPDQVAAVRIEKGWQPRVAGKYIVPCATAAPDAPLWQPATAALEGAVREYGGKPADVTVILSNHFAHYALVPQSGELDNDAEEMAFVRHCFARIYGRIADDWSFRLSDEPRGELRVAAAVDGSLLDAIREAVGPTRLRLRSIQPLLMAAFERCRRSLAGPTAWLVAAERGRLCVALLRGRRWQSIRTMRVGDDWIAELPVILDREAQLAGVREGDGEVWLFAPEHVGALPSAAGKRPVRPIRPTLRPGFSPAGDARFAMAMGGR